MITQEPRGLRFINNVNMATLGSITTNVCWFAGSSALTAVACILLLRQDYHLANGTLVIVEMQRQLGLTLAGFLLGAWTGKTVAGVVDSNNKRTAHPDYAPVLEAKERGKVAGAAAAAVIAEKAADMQAARAPVQGNGAGAAAGAATVTVNAADQSQVEVSAGAPGDVAVQTAVKSPTEPNAFTDDERDDG